MIVHDLEAWPVMTDDIALVAIGWLGRDIQYPTGEVAVDFFEKLSALCRHPWQPVVYIGLHCCELCQYQGIPFTGELYVPGRSCIYVAPVGVVHYIATHWYRRPQVFIEAVMACPPMRSMDYKRKLLENGGRGLLRALRRVAP
jgi:hypothetical protein